MLPFLVALAVVVHCAIPGDEITALPGYNGSLPSKQYSGWLNIGGAGNKSLHYWFVESEGNPTTDPMMFWFNGGPGCSSLGGFFTEGGPVRVLDGGKVIDNPYRWNKMASVLYIEMPAGAGFSKADTQAGYNSNDLLSAQDNLKAAQLFFKGFPEFSHNELYLSGESYAGIYVPSLAYQIVQFNKQSPPNPINLKGILVGNGCIGNSTGGCSSRDGPRIDIEFLAYHSLVPQSTYDAIKKTCEPEWNSPACQDAIAAATDKTGPVDVYDIYFPCASNQLRPGATGPDGRTQPAWHAPPNYLHKKMVEQQGKRLGVGPQGCFTTSDPLTIYLNQDNVRAAIHVGSVAELGQWRVCGPRVGGNYQFNYDSTEVDETKDIYPTLIDAGLRVLIYNGDVDACVPFTGNEIWTRDFGMTLGGVKAAWRPWMVSKQVAGYVTVYQKEFTYLTVKGAGHMVPQFQPEIAYNMVERFLANTPF